MPEVSPDIKAKYERFGSEKSEALNDFAKSFLPSNERKDEQIAQIVERMKVRLQLEKHLPENSHLDEFYLLAAHSLWDACELLHIPIPRFELIHQWHDQKAKTRNHAAGHAIAEYYTISLLPTYIEEMLEDSFGLGYQYDLMAIIYHEAYHLWQSIHFPKRYYREKEGILRIKKQNPTLADEITSIGRHELATLLFEHKILGEISPKTHKQFLVKMILILLKKWEISIVISARKSKKDTLKGSQ